MTVVLALAGMAGLAWLCGLALCVAIGLAPRRQWTPPADTRHQVKVQGIGAAVDYDAIDSEDRTILVATVDEADVTVTCAGYELGTSWALAIDGLHASGPCPNCGDTLTTEVR